MKRTYRIAPIRHHQDVQVDLAGSEITVRGEKISLGFFRVAGEARTSISCRLAWLLSEHFDYHIPFPIIYDHMWNEDEIGCRKGPVISRTSIPIAAKVLRVKLWKTNFTITSKHGYGLRMLEVPSPPELVERQMIKAFFSGEKDYESVVRELMVSLGFSWLLSTKVVQCWIKRKTYHRRPITLEDTHEVRRIMMRLNERSDSRLHLTQSGSRSKV